MMPNDLNTIVWIIYKMYQIDGNRVAIIKCPNKSNPYHQCTEWCARRWGTYENQEQNATCKIL